MHLVVKGASSATLTASARMADVVDFGSSARPKNSTAKPTAGAIVDPSWAPALASSIMIDSTTLFTKQTERRLEVSRS
jgi:hypothetical protein